MYASYFHDSLRPLTAATREPVRHSQDDTGLLKRKSNGLRTARMYGIRKGYKKVIRLSEERI